MKVISIQCDKCKQTLKPRYGESEAIVLTVTATCRSFDLCTDCGRLLANFLGVEVYALYRKD